MDKENKILIVDDQPYLLEALFDVLEQEGYRVTACKTALEAEHLIRTMNFEVAVLDLKIAESDGLALAVTLKKYSPNLAVLFLTAYPSQETAVKSLKIGAVDYLIKPVNVDELINAIKCAFNYREKNRDLESLKSNLISIKQELKQTKDALLKANKSSSLGQVSMEIFHELKNMLAVMNVSLYYLSKNVISPDDKIKKHMDIIEKQIRHSNNIIMSLLNFCSGSENKVSENIDASKILEEIIMIIEPELKIKSIKVIKNFSFNTGMIKINPDKLKQVFLNLILNSKDAMPEGGVLRIDTYKKDSNMFIEFSDTGSGIKEEDKIRIFDPFFSTKKDKKGIGLGLTVCREIVEEFSGIINAKNNSEKGTVFTIQFPLFYERIKNER